MKSKNQKILLFVANEYEDLELQYPKYRLREERKKVIVAGEKKKTVYKGKHGYPCTADVTFEEIRVNDFDALVIPGGYAPDKLRKIPKVLEITRKFDQQKKLIAFICHAGWILISAKILKGVQCTSYISIKEDILNAGAKWVDKAVVIDQHFISSRSPEDLPDFCSAIIHYLNQD
ncbi:MAG: type 1 glutamine amidotransferase domain-containing protein [Candidatus Rhabdochlamydia sp.]